GDGLLNLSGHSETFANLVTVDGQVTTGTNAVLTVTSLNMTGGTITASSAASQVVLNGNVTATSSANSSARINGPGTVALGGSTRTFTVADGPQTSDLVINAVITGTSGAGLTKDGAGRLELDQTNTYTGVTTISAGDVQV